MNRRESRVREQRASVLDCGDERSEVTALAAVVRTSRPSQAALLLPRIQKRRLRRLRRRSPNLTEIRGAREQRASVLDCGDERSEVTAFGCVVRTSWPFASGSHSSRTRKRRLRRLRRRSPKARAILKLRLDGEAVGRPATLGSTHSRRENALMIRMTSRRAAITRQRLGLR